MALTLSTSTLSPVCSERELIAAARDGDDRAFEELYARYSERIGGFILSRVRDRGRSEDVAQEVFISALRRLRASDREIAFKPWIYEIAKNACIDEHRRAVRSQEVSLDADADLTTGRGALLSVAPTPPAAVESKQRLADLRGAFGGLSRNHHQLLVLREFEGLSYEEIGARTGMSRQMVESALFRARRKLTEEYNELASGRRCQQVQGAIDSGRLVSQRKLGVRERRQFARHLAHCQPCRLSAHLAGVDESLVRPRTSLGAKIAALLPFPLVPWKLRGGQESVRQASLRPATHHGTLQTLQAVAVTGGEPIAGASTALGGAAVAIAALAIAGAGPGVSGQPTHPQSGSAALKAQRAAYAAPATSPATAPVPPILPAPSGTAGLSSGASAAHAGLGAGSAARARTVAGARRRLPGTSGSHRGHTSRTTPAPGPGHALPSPVQPLAPSGPGNITSGVTHTIHHIVQIPSAATGALSSPTVSRSVSRLRTTVRETADGVGSTGAQAERTLRADIGKPLNRLRHVSHRAPHSS